MMEILFKLLFLLLLLEKNATMGNEKKSWLRDQRQQIVGFRTEIFLQSSIGGRCRCR